MLTEGNDLSVIHIATSHTGGAGIAARRLNSELNSIGVRSSFYALAKKGFKPQLNEYGMDRNLFQRIAGGMSRILSDRLINQSFFSITSAPGISTRWLIKKVRREHAVLHIHNWFNLLTNRQLRDLISSGIPILITMHDQRFMTGGCHTALNCTKFHQGCFSCPRVPKPFRSKVRRNNAYFSHLFDRRIRNLQIVAPSKFIQSQATQSNLLKIQEVVFVPNILSSNYLQGMKKSNIQRYHSDEMIFGIASLNNKDWLKGSDLVNSLMSHYKNDSSVNFEFLTNFDSDREEFFWQSIDCLLVPSRGDNSPNVIHEAKIREIPIIASKVGGITELLSENFDFGVESQNLNLDGFIKAIETMRKWKISTKQRVKMMENFETYTSGSMDTLVKTYQELSNQSF